MAAAVQDPGSANLVLVATITLQSSSPSAKQDIIEEKAACIVGKKRNPKSASNSKKKSPASDHISGGGRVIHGIEQCGDVFTMRREIYGRVVRTQDRDLKS